LGLAKLFEHGSSAYDDQPHRKNNPKHDGEYCEVHCFKI
jgi:hypothetical protein